jgi:multimeric flavodoxin WrbA
MKVIAINSSPRKNGNTLQLIKTALNELKKEGIETEILEIGGKPIRGCTACYKCAENLDNRCVIDNDVINTCIEKMIEADGIILGSPTYFGNVTSEMKALIDRVGIVARVNKGLFKRKIGAPITAVRRGGAAMTIHSIMNLFYLVEMIVPGSNYWNFGTGKTPGDVENDKEGIRTMENLGQNMAWLMKKCETTY